MSSEDPIIIVDYNANWCNQYEQEKQRVMLALGDTVTNIQHIGSTSIPGLAAKPVIDMILGLKQIPPLLEQISNFEAIGYSYHGELGIPGRHYFRKGMPRTHQIHAVLVNSEFWERHILFRDFLRNNPQVAQRYEALKRKLAQEFAGDRTSYTNSKTPLIEQLLVEAALWQQTL
ncbi:GrpB family protein [Chlorogloea sp. CCALA 695]|uniref:GrpB family protein n=1 Tax=Chlorogloea sp. CCALA 695 TaxID=2107693 RepID=UPI000D0640CC|nr:GrpB family protein [Chlorogloea sp. CCALA 695]PSB29121.1 hypothetical protein C7B70_19070 [Chlorogloea sp. CCALA 695]